MVTQLEVDILEWSHVGLRKLCLQTGNKVSRDNGIPGELFQILKDDTVKSAALGVAANLKNSAVATRLEKFSFYSNLKET